MRRTFLFVVLVCLAGAWMFFRSDERQVQAFAHTAPHLAVGSVHLHSSLSHDSTIAPIQWEQAAVESGLDFIVLSDHNAQNGGPHQFGRVTVLSFAELSTPSGHVIEFGASQLLSSQDREGGHVLGRIRSLGGYPVIAHPSDWKRPWEGSFDNASGIEIANTASAVRRLGGPVLLGLLPSILVGSWNPELALAQTYDRDTDTLRRWDGESDPRLVGWCGNDAHGRFPVGFETRAWLTALNDPLPENEADRPAAIEKALEEGRFFCAAGLLGTRPDFSFAAYLDENVVAQTGDSICSERVDDLRVNLRGAKPGEFAIVLLRGGEQVARTEAGELIYPKPLDGTYRVEIRGAVPGLLFGERQVPVIYSNRIRILAESANGTQCSANPEAERP